MDASAQVAGGDVAALVDFVERHRRLLVLTGAGISTDSGIPGYRDEDGRWKGRQPVLFQDYIRSDGVRRRYWARSMVGWPLVRRAQPNAGHFALAALQRAGRIERLVTQNVDGLHQRAGTDEVIELHGGLDMVVCLNCGTRTARETIQSLLKAMNPGLDGASVVALPDGDAELEASVFATFNVPDCPHCAGMLKPDVVFFGENVPRARVDQTREALGRADAMLVVGSSLMVYSGFRFCEGAARLGKPIAALNRGRTRADGLLSLKVEASCAEALVALSESIAR
jgi:NAD-dependent SIR2 family protein deacetylase